MVRPISLDTETTQQRFATVQAEDDLSTGCLALQVRWTNLPRRLGCSLRMA